MQQQPPGPDSLRRPALAIVTAAAFKPPPLPTLPSRLSRQARSIDLKLPALIAGTLSSAFARAVADSLDNALATHYYFNDGEANLASSEAAPTHRSRVNLDRVLDRLITDFTKQLWDDLFRFYCQDNYSHVPHNDSWKLSDQVTKLFDGIITQIVLVLNGPETARCILDRIAPGLSRRRASWATDDTQGIELPLALQILCSYIHRAHPELSPGGSPDEIGRAIHRQVLSGQAGQTLVRETRQVLLSPHYVQMHLLETAVWDNVLRRPYPPSSDGFQVVQFRVACPQLLFGPQVAICDPQLVSIGSLPAITGTATGEAVSTTIADYAARVWPRFGPLLMQCLEEAIHSACASSSGGQGSGPFSGMSIWDGSDESKGVYQPGLRFIHVEIEQSSIQLSVSAWTHTLIDVFQQLAWTCAALSASPFPDGALSECALEVSEWDYVDGSVYANCCLAHRRVSEEDALPWLRSLHGAAVATGFPIDGFGESNDVTMTSS